MLAIIFIVGCQNAGSEGATAVPQPTILPITQEIVPTATAVAQTTNTPEPAAETAANADVLHVQATQTGDETWTFNVTVAHPDSGWEDYADGWDVLLPNGIVVKPDPNSPFTRLLLHPHETEQPFTRSQSGIIIPAIVTQVTVRAHDLVDGFGGQEVVVDLTAVSGTNFTIQR